MFVIAWIRSLFTRPARPAQHDTSLLRHLLRKNRNQSLRIKHLTKWRVADRQRIEELLSEIHDLTARIGELEADIAAATTPQPIIDDPDTWTPAMLDEYNQAEAERLERQLQDQHRIIHGLAEHIRQIAGITNCPDANERILARTVNEALTAADQADWEHADGYDGIPFPPTADKTQHRPAPNTDTLDHIMREIIATYDDETYSGSTERLDSLSPLIGLARIALGMLDPDEIPDTPDLALDVDFYDPVGDETAPDEAKPVRPPSNGTGEPDTARIETWDPSYPGQWRPLPAPAPHPYSPGGIL